MLFGAVHRRQEFDPAGISDLRAARSQKAGRLPAERLPARRLRLYNLLDLSRNPPRNRGKHPDMVQRFVDRSEERRVGKECA